MANRYWVQQEHVFDAEPWDAGHSDTEPYSEMVDAADYDRLRAALERIARGPDDEDDRGGELMTIARAALVGTATTGCAAHTENNQ